MSVQALANSIKQALEQKVQNESRAIRGTISNGRFYSGNKSYPFTRAVETTGDRVWAQLSPNNKAVIIGE